MFTQNKKKFHIIGSNPKDFFDMTVEATEILLKSDIIIPPLPQLSNPKDFFDMTVEATEILLKSDIIILSKNFHKTFFYFLRENKKKFIFKEDLSKNEDVKQWEKIYSLYKKFTSLSYLISGDPYFNYKNDLEVFLKKKKINVIKVIGILEIAGWVNKKNNFLTNREKNSSVFFFIPSSLGEIKKILGEGLSGKLVIIFKKEKLLNKLLRQLQKKSKVKYELYVNGHRQYLKNMPFILESKFSNAYLIFNRE